MTDITITLPQSLLDYAEEQVATGSCSDIPDFLRDLLRRDKAARDALWAALDEGEASGMSELTVEQIFERARERARSRAA